MTVIDADAPGEASADDQDAGRSDVDEAAGAAPAQSWSERAFAVQHRAKDVFLGDRANAHTIPLILLAVVTGYWTVTFVRLSAGHIDHYGTADFDLAIFDQASWLLSRGEGFLTTRGLEFFGHHLNLGLLLFAPVYWAGLGGPEFLNAVQVIALASSVVPIVLICRHYRPAQSWTPFGLSLVFLFNPVPQHLINESFHPEVMAVPFFLLAVWAAIERRWRWFAVSAVLMVCWKEDLALTMVMLGIGIAWKRDRRVGLVTVAVAAAYFVIGTRFVIPHFTGGDAFYADFLGPLGKTPGEVGSNLVRDPGMFADKYNENDGFGYFTGLQSSWAFASLLAPASLVMALPIYLVNVLSSQGYTQILTRHYVTIPFAVTAFSALRGVQSRTTGAVRAGLVVAALLVTVWTHDAGTGPWSARSQTGIWQLTLGTGTSLDAALDRLPEDAAVSASYTALPHVSRRHHAYWFPNPWKAEYWGIADRDPHPPDQVEWALIDSLTVKSPEHVELVERIRTSPCWETVYQDERVYLGHRRSSDCGL